MSTTHYVIYQLHFSPHKQLDLIAIYRAIPVYSRRKRKSKVTQQNSWQKLQFSYTQSDGRANRYFALVEQVICIYATIRARAYVYWR